MKFIHNKHLVELTLVFEANQVVANCSQANAKSKDVTSGKFINYADLVNSSFQISDFIVGKGEKYSEEEIIKSFSMNAVVLNVCSKMDAYLASQK